MTLNPYEPPAGGTPSDATGANSPLAGWESIVKRLLVWCVGFVLLFAINVFVELLVLPRWGLDESPENDIYFTRIAAARSGK